jgi:hypothetical protein
MPLTLRYLNERQGVFAEASGQLTGSELISAMATVNAPTLAEAPVLYTFFDFNGVTGVGITTDQIRAVAELALTGSRYQSVPRLVAIHAEADLTFALARMWQVFVDETGWETMVFRKRTQAVDWVRERMAARFGIEDLDLDTNDPAERPSA